MRATRTLAGAATAVALLVAGAGTAHGQASESEMRAFPMPPAEGYAQTKHFTRTGDHGYFAVPSTSAPGGGAEPGDYRYVRYTGVAGRNVWLYGTWGTTPVPAPVGGRDACAHAHASYGVWARERIWLWTRWRFLGGGGMSGVRDAAGRCTFRVDNPIRSIDARYGWGREALNVDLTGVTTTTELVLGVQSNTHGWGSCGAFACLEPSWAIGYVLP